MLSKIFKCTMVVTACCLSTQTHCLAQTYSYDALGRVTQVVTSAGITSVYRYDAAGNRTGVTVSGSACSTPSPSSVVVANRCFEGPDEGSGYQYQPTVAGMSFGGNAGIAANGSAWGFVAPEGKQVGFLQAAPGASGSITVALSNMVANQQYVVMLQAGQRPGFPADPFTIAIGGNTIGVISPGAGFSSYSSGPFTASATSASLVLATTPAAQDSASGVDQITIVPIPAVADGSFEQPNVGSASFQYNPSSSGVSFAGLSGVASNGSAWGFPAAPDGNQVAFLQSVPGHAAGSITQQFSGLTVGRTYAVSFQATHRPNYGTNPITVSMNGTALATVSPPDQFTSYTTSSFVASATTATLTFSVGNTSTDSGNGVDAVFILPQ